MKLNNKGTTMVEITVGFLLLVILFVSFVKIIDLSADMTKYSIDIKNKNIEFEEMYYGIETDLSGFGETGAQTITDPNNGGNELQIKICEWTPKGNGYFNEWDYDSTTKKFIETTPATAPTLVLSNVHLKKIENLSDDNASKLLIYKYLYTKPVPVTSDP